MAATMARNMAGWAFTRGKTPAIGGRAGRAVGVATRDAVARWQDYWRPSSETLLFERFRPQNSHEVFLFLAKYQFLVPVLLEATKVLPLFFDDEAFALTVMHDPEENNSELVVLIETPRNTDEARPLLDRFNEFWWLEAMDLVKGKLSFSLLYQ